MPYINIKEEDITLNRAFDDVDNVVLIFGFDFHLYKDVDTEEMKKKVGPYYKLYTSLREFYRDVNPERFNQKAVGIKVNPTYRPYLTAYDCLSRDLPVMYVSMDDFIIKGDDDILNNLIIDLPEVTDPDTGDVTRSARKYIEYNWFDGNVPEIPDTESAFKDSYWGLNGFLFATELDYADEVRQAYIDYTDHIAEKTLLNMLKFEEKIDISGTPTTLRDFSDLVPLNDKVTMPISFITTCGYEDYVITEIVDDSTKHIYDFYSIMSMFINKDPRKGIPSNRLDLVYLYDINPEVTPESLTIDPYTTPTAFDMGERVNAVYPWATFNLYNGISNAHMPGSYAWLMAYATSIKSNKSWLAAAGINRGRIPNIVGVDYDIREAYIHLWQGDNDDRRDEGLEPWSKNIRVNPIVNFGANYGMVVFGNRTCYSDQAAVTFKKFLNVRLLLLKIHKEAFKASITHMFEPNDDITWLSFKQSVNNLLDDMVTGRGLRYYKWRKLKPSRLGEIRARLTIRPIEAVESFDITISMTDEDIEVTETTYSFDGMNRRG